MCNPTQNTFQVAIIPYTFEHTNFCDIKVGSVVNLEFDIIGKYIARLQQIDNDEEGKIQPRAGVLPTGNADC